MQSHAPARRCCLRRPRSSAGSWSCDVFRSKWLGGSDEDSTQRRIRPPGAPRTTSSRRRTRAGSPTAPRRLSRRRTASTGTRRTARAVDEAAFALCRLRRAQAGLKGGPQQGDAAVRRVLEEASPEVVVWLASRTISYLDETGFPEAVEPWFPDAVADDVLSGRAARGEREREEDGAGEVGRERQPVAALAPGDRGAVAEQVARLRDRGAELVLVVDVAAERRRGGVEDAARARVGAVLRLGIGSVVDALAARPRRGGRSCRRPAGAGTRHRSSRRRSARSRRP